MSFTTMRRTAAGWRGRPGGQSWRPRLDRARRQHGPVPAAQRKSEHEHQTLSRRVAEKCTVLYVTYLGIGAAAGSVGEREHGGGVGDAGGQRHRGVAADERVPLARAGSRGTGRARRRDAHRGLQREPEVRRGGRLLRLRCAGQVVGPGSRRGSRVVGRRRRRRSGVVVQPRWRRRDAVALFPRRRRRCRAVVAVVSSPRCRRARGRLPLHPPQSFRQCCY